MGHLQRLPVLIRDEAGLNQEAVDQSEHHTKSNDSGSQHTCGVRKQIINYYNYLPPWHHYNTIWSPLREFILCIICKILEKLIILNSKYKRPNCCSEENHLSSGTAGIFVSSTSPLQLYSQISDVVWYSPSEHFVSRLICTVCCQYGAPVRMDP